MKIMIVETDGKGLRSKVIGINWEDTTFLLKDKHIGFTPCGPSFYNIEKDITPLHILADGWKLLSPPKVAIGGAYAEWWFTLG